MQHPENQDAISVRPVNNDKWRAREDHFPGSRYPAAPSETGLIDQQFNTLLDFVAHLDGGHWIITRDMVGYRVEICFRDLRQP